MISTGSKPIGLLALALNILLLSACDKPVEQQQIGVKCDPDNGGLTLPAGFCALVVADHISFLRHITVHRNGDIYGARRSQRLKLGGIVAARDSDGDGKADIVQEFGDEAGLGIAIQDGYLYFGTDNRILRYQLDDLNLVPAEEPQVMIDGFPEQERHAGKSFTLDKQNHIYINIGAASNACQEQELVPGSPGVDPCPELEFQASIWRFNDKMVKQTFPEDGDKYASGIRNAYAISWNHMNNNLYAVQHGRDGLQDLWPDIYSEQEGAEQPAEELLKIDEGSAFGWPYCYFDAIKKQEVLAPEYGGDGEKNSRCKPYEKPVMGFPAHFSPNDLIFYHADQFPNQYRNGAFIAFHGSYNRGSLEQVGYQVVYVPFKDDLPTGNWQVFADGFSGTNKLAVPEDAEFRPVGLAVGPDGSLYIADSVQGRIWRVMFQDASPTPGE